MRKTLSMLLVLALVFTLIPAGGLIANAYTLNVTFAAGGNYNGGTMNITYATSNLVRGTEYEFAFYDSNNNILSHSVAENRQWFGLKFASTDYGTVQVDSTNAWYPSWNYNTGAVGTIIILPMPYMFIGATKLEIREKATPTNTTGILTINTALISTGNSNATFNATNCLPSSVAGCIKAPKGAPRWNPGTVWYYLATSTGASLPSATVKASGALMMIKGSGHDGNLNVDMYLTNPSYAYYNIANSIGTSVQSPAISTAQLNGLTPATPSYISAVASTGNNFKINGLLPLTYEIIQDNSANTPASWAGCTDVYAGQGTSGDIAKTGNYLHIRTKAGTKITNNSSCYNLDISSLGGGLVTITASENAADPLSFIADGEQKTFNVTTSGSVDAGHPITLNVSKQGGAAWLTVSQSANQYTSAGSITVTVTASENTGAARNETLNISFSGDTGYYSLPGNLSVSVSQDEAEQQGPVVAFPGAEGFGKYSAGGRGGDVYYVTNLNDTGAGSLRYGIDNATAPRTIVFAIGGTIALQSNLNIREEKLTIAGQTAPGGGITIRNYGILIQADDVIVRYIRARVGDLNLAPVDAIGVGSGQRVIIDHCSCSWALDETLSVSYWSSGSTYTVLDDVTVQWCFMTEPCHLNPDYEDGTRTGKGTLINADSGAGISIHHNLYASASDRVPRFGSYKVYADDPVGPQIDFRNNVIFNYNTSRPGYASGNDHARTYSMVKNYYKAGSASPTNTPKIGEEPSQYADVYANGNSLNGTITEGATNLFKNWSGVATWLGTEPNYGEYAVTTESAANALTSVLADAGASLVRDSVDTRIVSEVNAGTGQFIQDQNDVGGWPSLAAGSAPTDTDSDGMPNSWETANGLNINDASDRNDYDLSGSYTNLEMYLNSLVA